MDFESQQNAAFVQQHFCIMNGYNIQIKLCFFDRSSHSGFCRLYKELHFNSPLNSCFGF